MIGCQPKLKFLDTCLRVFGLGLIFPMKLENKNKIVYQNTHNLEIRKTTLYRQIHLFYWRRV